MINWSDADHRMQAHRTITDRINQQAWRRQADQSGEPVAPGARATFKEAWTWCRAAARRLALPINRGAQPV